MTSIAYREAYSEVLDILNHTRREDVDKIPMEFMEYLKENASKTYTPQLNHELKIKDMKLKSKTKAILAIIYRKFWCSEEQKKEFDKKLKENEIRKHQETLENHSKNIFKTEVGFKELKANDNIDVEEPLKTEIVPYKETFFSKLINKIKAFFGKK